MTGTDAFLLNVNEGQDTLHDLYHLDERCNTDDVEGRKTVDPKTAAALIANGQAQPCHHCMPTIEEEAS